MKRKRARGDARSGQKRQKVDDELHPHPVCSLLRNYYTEVVTLRQYLASRLSKIAKKRRKKLQQYGRDSHTPFNAGVAKLLDETLVGAFKRAQVDDSSFSEEDFTVFTQQLSNDATILSELGTDAALIVDFTVWLLFRKQLGNQRPKHLLCQNFQRYLTEISKGTEPELVPGIPGVYAVGRNEYVQTLKNEPWTMLPELLGKIAERILSDLLLECAIFTRFESSSNFTQLSGIPMCDLPAFSRMTLPGRPDTRSAQTEGFSAEKSSAQRGLSNIRFVRQRILYARAAIGAKGDVRYGLGQFHVLNRCRDLNDRQETCHIMKYIFPLQFGLHNVLTSNVDPTETTEKFKDYTTREQEIARQTRIRNQKRRATGKPVEKKPPSTPKRLRGKLLELVLRLRKRHCNGAYATLLEYYCPYISVARDHTTGSIRQATTETQVSAFCRAAVTKVFPKDLWGGASNLRVLHQKIDRFIRLRRYETMSLHDVLQDMAVRDIEWLASSEVDKTSKMSKTEFAKRKELMAELLYYLFDSFLTPLIRGHFHATESNDHRNQLFYFRHDVWKAMSEPALTSLKNTMLEECSTTVVKRMLATRALGVSHVRLLPKEQGMRPIINLRRRAQKLQYGQLVLGKSINSILTPAFSVLNCEKSANAGILGSALFSVDDIFPRLQTYRRMLAQKGCQGKPLYFAKVDVQACFDTIPQERLLRLVKKIIGAEQYQIARYSRAKLLGNHSKETPGFGAKPSWKFLTKAVKGAQAFDFRQDVEDDIAEGRSKSVYINGIAQRRESRHAILALLEEHVASNLIKIGKRFYRQKEGIPQGSIVSSLLCSYFYAELEREWLGFVDDGNSVLLRLIDDFLVISTELEVVQKFMRVMHAGIPEFGVKVKVEKSRANFDMEIAGKTVQKLTSDVDFPYCGNAINTVTLDMSKDMERRRRSNMADAVTVEFSKLPGQSFYRKTLNALKLQMHAMLLSTSYNTLATVLANLHHAFVEVAQKSYYYIKSLPPTRQPGAKLSIQTVDDVIKLACVLMKRRRRTSKDVMAYECCVSHAQAKWLACTAFTTVFRRRQTKHRQLLAWLRVQLEQLEGTVLPQRRLLLDAASRWVA